MLRAAAFCLVLRELNKDPNYLVKLPVFLDATCSGIQQTFRRATLIKDYELGGGAGGRGGGLSHAASGPPSSNTIKI